MPDTQKLKKRLRRKVHYDTAVLVLMSGYLLPEY